MLETEIKNLSEQIERLNNNFAKFFESQTSTVSAPEKVTVGEVGQAIDDNQLEQNEPEITKDSLRSLCLVKSREDKDNKAKIKAILKDLGAKLVDDLSENNLIKANELIGAL